MGDFSLYYFSIRWQDIVDILLNSYLLFRFYVLFRGTIVLRGLIGIALLWFVQRMSVFMGLVLTSWAIQGITAVAALIIIVIFRNEIRGVLQTKNLKSMLWGVTQRPQAQTPVEIIVESVFEMSQKYIGALIVLPGEKDIKELIQNGISWQGKLSKEMIISVFFHDNPVHDGAAIIQGDRMTDVGVILPLSHRKDIPSYYGTRHRAALGIAEASDALVVVVSEESGRVISAKGNKITPVHRKGLLAEIIQDHLRIKTTDSRDYQKREKMEIGAAALVSLLFVIAIWFSFSKGLYTLVTMEAPIEYMNRKPGMEIFDTSVKAVQLHLSGSGALIKSVRPEQMSVRIDLSKARPGENMINITQNDISLPPGVFLRKVEPSTVEVTTGVPITKELPIQVDWEGKLSSNLIMTGVKLAPETVSVVGPRWVMENTGTIYTQKIDLDKIQKSGQLKANLALESEDYIKIATGAKPTVTVEYTVRERK